VSRGVEWLHSAAERRAWPSAGRIERLQATRAEPGLNIRFRARDPWRSVLCIYSGRLRAWPSVTRYLPRCLAARRMPAFDGLRGLLRRLGFDERIRGSHHIFTKTGVEEILNLQPKGRNAKPYQVKQVRAVIVKHRLAGGANGQ